MTIIKHRRGTASEWTTDNPVLAEGEIGFEKDTGKFKIGTGDIAWTSLVYFLSESDILELFDATQTVLDGKVDDADLTNAVNGLTNALALKVETIIFAVTGTIADAVGKSRVYLEGNYTIQTVRASVGTAPTGGNEIIDVNKNAVTLYTTQSARPTIASGAFTATGNSPAITTFVAGDYITVDIDADGTATGRATDLTVVIRLLRTS